MVGALLFVLAISLLFHEQAAALKALHFFRIPGTNSYFDFPTLALCLLMFTASVQCKFRDFGHLLDSPRAAIAGLLLHYVAVPFFAVFCSSLAVGVFDGEAAVQIRLGLIFIALMPVALTAAVWVRANRGNVPLLLTLVVITTAAAVVTVPLYVRFIPGTGAGTVVLPVAEMVKQLVLTITMPLLLGMLVQHHFPKFVARWAPFFSLVGMFSLFASSGSNVGAAAPMIAAHRSLLAAAAVVTLVVSGSGYALGLLLARWLRLNREDALCLTFGSGMKNPAAAMVIGAASFPTMPLVPVPAALTSIVQHLIAGFLTKSFEDVDGKLLGRSLGSQLGDLEERITRAYALAGRRDPDIAVLVFRLAGAHETTRLPNELLSKISRAVRADDYVCGLPPNGFAIMMAHASPVGIARVVDKVIALMATERVSGWSDLRLGIAESSAGATCADELIESALADAAKRTRRSLPQKPSEESCTRSPSFLETESVPK